MTNARIDQPAPETRPATGLEADPSYFRMDGSSTGARRSWRSHTGDSVSSSS